MKLVTCADIAVGGYKTISTLLTSEASTQLSREVSELTKNVSYLENFEYVSYCSHKLLFLQII